MRFPGWPEFVEGYWEKRPLVIRQPPARRIISSDRTFQGLRKISELYRAGDSEVALDFYVDQTNVGGNVGKHLPRRQDQSVSRYSKRLKRSIHGRSFGLVAGNFHAYEPEIWLRTRDYLYGLFEQTGIPGNKTTTALFLGDYPTTPFGLHAGDAATFVFVIEGRKRIRVWPPGILDGRPNLGGAQHYQEHLHGSIILEGTPGDVFYWPSQYWHIGESVTGKLAVSLSVAIFLNSTSAGSKTKSRYPVRIDGIQKTARKLGRMARPRKSQVRWLNNLSGWGFARVPLPAEETIALQDQFTVGGNPRYPVLWMPAGKGEIICSSNGHAFSVAAHPKLLKLFEHLNSGKTASVLQLIEKYAGSVVRNGIEFAATRGDIRKVLEKLERLRAISVITR